MCEGGRGAFERRVTEREHTTVGADQPVTLAGGRRRDGDDRSDQPSAVADGTVEYGITEREDPAVGAREPVAVPLRRRRDADDRRHERPVGDRTREAGVAEREHTTVLGRDPISTTAGRGREVDEVGVQAHCSRRSQRGRATNGAHRVRERVVDAGRRAARARQDRAAGQQECQGRADEGDRRNRGAT